MAWQGPMHVGHMASHVSHCIARAYACRTHGKPCVWHMACHVSSCMALLNPINRGFQFSSWGEQQGEGGGREKRKEGKEKRRSVTQ